MILDYTFIKWMLFEYRVVYLDRKRGTVVSSQKISAKATLSVRRAVLIGCFDIISIIGSFFLGLWLRFDFSIGAIPREYLNKFLVFIAAWCVVSIFTFSMCKLYNSIWTFVSVDELFRIIDA